MKGIMLNQERTIADGNERTLIANIASPNSIRNIATNTGM